MTRRYVTGVDWHLLTVTAAKNGWSVVSIDLDDVDVGYGGFVDFDTRFVAGSNNVWALSTLRCRTLMIWVFNAQQFYRQIRTAHTRTTSDLSWAWK